MKNFRDETPKIKRKFWVPPQGSKQSHSAGEAEAIVMSKQDDNYFCCNETINKLKSKVALNHLENCHIGLREDY